MARTRKKAADRPGTVYGGASLVEEPAVDPFGDDDFLGGLGELIPGPQRAGEEGGAVRSLRRFGRVAVWTLPGAAICLAFAALWGWPTATAEPSGTSPGTWLVITVFGLLCGVTAALAITALVAATPGRRWAIGAVLATLAGTVLLAPVLGVIGVARPAVTRLAGGLGPDVAADLEVRFFDGGVSRWLGVGGLTLLAVGWFAVGCAILASGVLNRVDGFLVLAAVAGAVLSAYLSWQFLLVLAAMAQLAAGLGVAWTAARLVDGDLPGD